MGDISSFWNQIEKLKQLQREYVRWSQRIKHDVVFHLSYLAHASHNLPTKREKLKIHFRIQHPPAYTICDEMETGLSKPYIGPRESGQTSTKFLVIFIDAKG